MIVQKPADLDPAMKSALKNHIMRKRQQLKQELEQDAIEKRIKREQEAKRKQDAMTLDQLKEQLSHLERTLDNLKNEKHHLFLQLKQNMRVLNEDDKQRKQKEEEASANNRAQQNNEVNNRQQQPVPLPVVPNHHPQSDQGQSQNHHPTPPLSHQPQLPQAQHVHLLPQHVPQQTSSINQSIPQSQPLQLPQLQPSQQTPLPLHHPNSGINIGLGGPVGPNTNSINNQAHSGNQNRNANQQALKDSMSIANLSRDSMSPNKKLHTQQQLQPQQQQQQQQLQPPPQQLQPQQQLQPPPQQQQPQPQQLQSVPPHSAPSSQASQLPANLSNPYLGYPGLHPGLGGPQIGGPQMQPNLVNQNLIRTPPPAQNLGSLFNPAAFSHLLGPNFPRQPSLFGQLPQTSRPSIPFGHHPMSPYQPLGSHHSGAPVTSNSSNNNSNNTGSNMSINKGGSLGLGPNSNINHASNSNSHNTLLQSMKRPISATNLTSETVSPNKKLHTQQQPPPPPVSSQPHQLPANLTNPYLSYTGLPPHLQPQVNQQSLQASMFQQSLMRTPPPGNMSSLFNSATISHLLSAQGYPRQSPYLPHLSQPPRPSLPFGHHPMSPYPQFGHHPGIPTSLSHASQSNPMIRPSPPPPNMQLPNNPGQMNPGGHKLPNMPMTTSGPLDFNPNLSSATAHQMQQQALNNQAVAAAAAQLGLQLGPQYFNRYPL